MGACHARKPKVGRACLLVRSWPGRGLGGQPRELRTCHVRLRSASTAQPASWRCPRAEHRGQVRQRPCRTGSADYDECVVVSEFRGYSLVGRYDWPKQDRTVAGKTESVPEMPNMRAFRIRGRTASNWTGSSRKPPGHARQPLPRLDSGLARRAAVAAGEENAANGERSSEQP